MNYNPFQPELMDWELTKSRVDRLSEPLQTDLVKARIVKDGTHKEHPLSRYSYVQDFYGYELDFDWGYCKFCRELRYKKWVLINTQNHVVYVRELVTSGKQVEDQIAFAEELFAGDVISAPSLALPNGSAGRGAVVIPPSPSQ